MEKQYTIALAGNPNVGKSTIFNSLTGMHQHTGNWTGKTIENAEGIVKINNKEFKIIDIPGTYSIMSNSEEEEIARDYICFGKPDVTVVVVDGTALERNLNLVFQIMEITDNVILCVNLLDEAKKKNIKIDLKKLSELLEIPVIGTIAKNKKTLTRLKNKIYDVSNNSEIDTKEPIQYKRIIENSIKEIEKEIYIENYNVISKKVARWIAIKLIDGEEKILQSIQDELNINLKGKKLQNKLNEVLEKLDKDGINQENFRDEIVSAITRKAEKIANKVMLFEDKNYRKRDERIDKILTSKKFGIPIMILFLGIIFWITIVGANYPSNFLFSVFGKLQSKLYIFAGYIGCPEWISSMLIGGVYQTLTWVVAVMLPPMAIFFPLFTILEDLGYLPRMAFNMDVFFKKACCNGKQMITMCMGFGCNSCGITGCRIIDSPRERLIAILTNNLVPCNGRFPILISIATIFIAGIFTHESDFFSSIISTLSVIIAVVVGIIFTLLISKILSKTILNGLPSSFVLELPPYRKPQFGKLIIRSIFDRTLFILGRAISISAPAGLVIWLMANIGIDGNNLLNIIANFLEPFAKLMGLDGYILTAFILGIPANEIVFPIILMCYLGVKQLVNIEDLNAMKDILLQNNWSILTAINVMIFTVFHFPCATSLLTIKKETKSLKWTLVAFAIPTVCGILICMCTTIFYNFILKISNNIL